MVVVATERFFTICKPFHRNIGGVCEGWGYISLVATFSFLYNVTKFLEFETYYVREDPEDDNRRVSQSFFGFMPCHLSLTSHSLVLGLVTHSHSLTVNFISFPYCTDLNEGKVSLNSPDRTEK